MQQNTNKNMFPPYYQKNNKRSKKRQQNDEENDNIDYIENITSSIIYITMMMQK